MEKDFDNWNVVKKNISGNEGPDFSERDIWWCAVGKNLGEEANGKNELFERPVVVFKKLSKKSFIGFPITTKVREGSYFYSYHFGDKSVSIMLHQARVFSNKRLLRKVGKLSNKNFNNVRGLYLNLFSKIESPPFGGLSRTPSGEDNLSISS